MTDDAGQSHDAQTTPIGARTKCPQCGVQLDAFTTSCAECGAVVTGGTMDASRMEKVRARLQDGVGAAYRLGSLLGRGGMGIVFQARELALDRDVALKVLAFDPLLNPDAFERFEREAKLAARLDHPNIVPIFSVGQGNGIAFYTMRMVRGGSVEGLLAGGRALELPRAVAILRDVASALDYAHDQGVVHRDIKPANVLLSDSGHAMVADFGIARAFTGPASGATSATGTGVVGSPAYMSPEQWRGEKVDGRADQYALGVLAFELLAGVRPFSGDSMQELLRMHLQDDAPDIISVRHDLPSHLTDAIRRAMAKQPAARFASSGEFVEALAGSSVARAVRPHSAAAGAATVRTPLPAAHARVPAGVAHDASEQSGAAARERRSFLPWLALLLIAGAGAAVIFKLAPSGSETGTPAAAIVPAPVDSGAGANANELGDLEKRMQAQIDEARRIAVAAEKRADSMAAANRVPGAGSAASSHDPASRDVSGARVYVLAQGGTPQIYLDGVAQNVAAPALLNVPPGRHTIRVRGLTPFQPADTTIEVGTGDTLTVVFRGLRQEAQRAGGNAGAPRPAGAATGAGADVNRARANALAEVNWDEWVRKLGFDPRTADVRRLTPEQRLRYRQFTQMMDSLRRVTGRRP